MDLNDIWELTGERRHAEALAALEALPAQPPGSRDRLYLQALNLRLLQRVPEALTALSELERLDPRYSRLHQERGQCYVLLRDARRAIEALQQAVGLNVALPISWDLLRRLYRTAGDSRGAATAAEQLAALNMIPAAVTQASSLFADGDFLPAERIIRDYLHKDASHVGAMRLLARIGLVRGNFSEAETLLACVLKSAPDFHAARLDYALVLLHQQKFLASRQEAQRLLRHEQDNREYLKQYAAACIGLGDHEPVIKVYARLLRGMPSSGPEVSDLYLWRGNALKTTGRLKEAVADYHAALLARPDSGAPWFSLANLKTHRFSAEDLARMRAVESQLPSSGLDRCYLSFALGKALEDCQEYAASWSYYEQGNAIKRSCGRPYDPVGTEHNARLQLQAYDAKFFADRRGWGAPDTSPIFIVGLPRSGSTLIEQILASHPEVEGTQELAAIGHYAAELGTPDRHPGRAMTADPIGGLSLGDCKQLGERFIDETHIYRKLKRPFFIDKMPSNFWHIALIHLMLPNAKIIDARREPMACCFGNFKQLYGSDTQPFSYRVEDIAGYYRTYLDMIEHWHRVLPGRVLTLHHENIVDNLDDSVRRLLAHCGLPWDPACVAFHRTQRSVHSASSEQVRRPIDPESDKRWRSYEPWLGGLRQSLGDALIRYRT